MRSSVPDKSVPVFSKMFTWTQGFTQSPIQWGPRAVSSVSRNRKARLTTHLHLVLRTTILMPPFLYLRNVSGESVDSLPSNVTCINVTGFIIFCRAYLFQFDASHLFTSHPLLRTKFSALSVKSYVNTPYLCVYLAVCLTCSYNGDYYLLKRNSIVFETCTDVSKVPAAFIVTTLNIGKRFLLKRDNFCYSE